MNVTAANLVKRTETSNAFFNNRRCSVLLAHPYWLTTLTTKLGLSSLPPTYLMTACTATPSWMPFVTETCCPFRLTMWVNSPKTTVLPMKKSPPLTLKRSITTLNALMISLAISSKSMTPRPNAASLTPYFALAPLICSRSTTTLLSVFKRKSKPTTLHSSHLPLPRYFLMRPTKRPMPVSKKMV